MSDGRVGRGAPLAFSKMQELQVTTEPAITGLSDHGWYAVCERMGHARWWI